MTLSDDSRSNVYPFKKPASKGFRFVSMLTEIVPPVFINERFNLEKDSINVYAGYGSSRKTMLCQYIALHIAYGKPLFGKFPVERCKVMHLDYEQGVNRTLRRYKRMANVSGIVLDDEWMKFSPAGQNIKITDPSAEVELIKEIEGFNPGLVIIDSFKASTDIDENSSKIREPIDMVAQVCRPRNCAAIIIHHARKPGVDETKTTKCSIRGNGAIRDACDSTVLFHADSKNKISIVEMDKMRDSEEDSTPFGIKIIDIPYGDNPKWGMNIQYISNEQLVNIQSKEKELHEQETACQLHNRIREKFMSLPYMTFKGTKTELVKWLGIKSKTGFEIISNLISQCKIIMSKANETSFRWIE